MSNQPTTRRRAVSIPKETELPSKADEQPLAEVSVENAPVEENNKVQQEPEAVQNTEPETTISDEDWERKIAEAKKAKQVENTQAIKAKQQHDKKVNKQRKNLNKAKQANVK